MESMSVNSPVWAVPSEVTEHTLTFCHPRDVAVFSRTCRGARDLLYRSPDQYLWRQLFLAHFDDPRKAIALKQLKECDAIKDYDWKGQLQRRISAESVRSKIALASPEVLDRTCATFITVLEEALPYAKDQESMNTEWLAKILRNVNFSGDPDMPQRLHRLLSYLSLSHRDFFHYDGKLYPNSELDDTKRQLEPLRTTSRCFVYDLRNYTANSRYGPYSDSTTINWKHLQYNINVILMNLREFQRMWPGVRPPMSTMGLRALRAYSAPGTLETRNTRDWAGVEGNWRRFVCFMDYRDLFSFNFGSLRHLPGRGARDGSFFADSNFQEATRLVETELHLIELSDDPDHDADLEFSFVGHPRGCRALHPEDPSPIHFTGVSRGSNGNESNVKGCVRIEAGGIRWRWVSIHDHNTQWSAEGLQIGQICSAAGVVGNWTGAYHEEGDPAGPYWFWKVDDDFPSNIVDYFDE
ncbi:hypothetical protein NEOLEDRAFT_1135916 [Neolentinus lepideus HHB14362 ss-1]|uniref:F-box domain-containing protein n=1 Tax=Neolentinus lepideus HHB14362 ss-1 TaxID=1314782 RepID=A0A165RGQ9_9AGAM|nr:hypothetical protein NEOLEDRAFT_1135916 [Neolentinus lepideus HHB14362 ss-1]